MWLQTLSRSLVALRALLQESWSLESLVASPAVADWMGREVVKISLSFTGFDIFLCFVFIIFLLEMAYWRNRNTNS